jgi:hypothetical protein
MSKNLEVCFRLARVLSLVCIAREQGRKNEEKTMATTKEKCPVCGDEMNPDAQSIKIGGKTVRVCCDDCAKQAKANPKKYGAAST